MACHSNGFTQNFVPQIKTYTTANYNGGHQNWGIDQAHNGYIYVANQNGLLEFNGNQWSSYPLPNGTIARSVHCLNGRIYVGSYQEFGYFLPEPTGLLSYHSLSDKLQNHDFSDDEFWEIIEFGEKLVFRSFSDVYLVDENEEVNVLNLDNVPTKVVEQHGKLNIFFINGDLSQIDSSGNSEKIITPADFKKGGISIAKKGDELIVCSSDFQCYNFDGTDFQHLTLPEHSFFQDNQLNKLCILHDGNILLGSIQKGILVVDQNFNQIFLANQAEGLSNNTILDYVLDQYEDIWLATDNGITYLNYNSPNRFFIDATGRLGSVYDIQHFKNTLYLGSNKGLFYFNDQNQLEFVEGTDGQVWFLEEINDELICGHNEATFSVANGKAQIITDFNGGWNLKAIPGKRDEFLQSTYNGILHFSKSNGWKVKRIGTFLSPIRDFVFLDNHSILATHAYQGIFKISFSPDYDSIISISEIHENGLENEYKLRLTSLNNQILVHTNKDWHRYNPVLNNFPTDSSVNRLINYSGHLDFFPSNSKNEFFLYKNNYLFNLQPFINKIDTLEVPGIESKLIDYYEQVYIHNQEYYLTLINGFLKTRKSTTPLTDEIFNIASIKTGKDFVASQKSIKINKNEPIEVILSRSAFDSTQPIYYRVNDQSADWQISRSGTILINNHTYGKHQLEVRMENINGNQTIKTIDYFVKYPWYLRWYSLVLLCAFIALSLYGYRRLEIKKITQKQKERERTIKERKRIENQRELAEIKSEKLEMAVDAKKKELANTTLSLVQKTELLNHIKSELLLANKENPNVHVSNVLKSINQSSSGNKNWKLFETQFSEVHNLFLQKLKKEFPDLTKNDLKLCAYLKTELTSKEIAPLMNKSTRGVETHRYRLRKKLEIDTNENFQKFLENL